MFKNDLFYEWIPVRWHKWLLLLMASFVIGLVKFVGLLELIIIMIPVLMPDGKRYTLYAAYYPLALISAQITSLIAAIGSGNSGWRFGQLPFAALLLIGMLITLVVARDEGPGRKIPLYRVDWPGLILIVIFLLLFDYALSYGQTKDWYASKEILIATVVAFAAHGLAVSRATTIKRPILLFPALSYKNVVIGLVILFFLCLLFSGGIVINALRTVVLKNDLLENTYVDLFMIPGFIAVHRGERLFSSLIFTGYGYTDGLYYIGHLHLG